MCYKKLTIDDKWYISVPTLNLGRGCLPDRILRTKFQLSSEFWQDESKVPNAGKFLMDNNASIKNSV